MSTKQLYTVAEKKASFTHHLLECGDKVKSRWKDRHGKVVGKYDHFVWVLWENAAELCGMWKPETVDGCDLIYVGPPNPDGSFR